ncbi:uncharacterized protein LOC135197512 [Macrobrachium nipponense]|uniref:uncharacterized protein LOC135197512 n=1 Tax=Macrobrachium nipponense TaxID=159736 RepID=UPI0030C7EA8F
MIYKRTHTKVITAVGETENFEVRVGLHQRSALSPFLFVMVMDVLSEVIRNEELWELLYTNDLVIIAENEEDIQRTVGEWKESLERVGLKKNATQSSSDPIPTVSFNAAININQLMGEEGLQWMTN